MIAAFSEYEFCNILWLFFGVTLGYGLGDGELAIRFQAVAEKCLLNCIQANLLSDGYQKLFSRE
jgi:hypothetical protein